MIPEGYDPCACIISNLNFEHPICRTYARTDGIALYPHFLMFLIRISVLKIVEKFKGVFLSNIPMSAKIEKKGVVCKNKGREILKNVLFET